MYLIIQVIGRVRRDYKSKRRKRSRSQYLTIEKGEFQEVYLTQAMLENLTTSGE